MSVLTSLICCHLIGDFLLQNHWMQEKSKDYRHCSVHVAFYALPFLLSIEAGIIPHGWLVASILIQHWIQDRFALHLRWMTFFRQTPATIWPTGPLCVDQAWHIGFIYLFCILFT